MWSTQDISGRETILYGTCNGDYTCVGLSKPTELTPPRVNPKVNYGLRVTMPHLRTFITWKNAPFWWGILIIGEAVPVQNSVYEKSL